MKNAYITTAIPYANAAPHIGTAMDYLYGDILLRYFLGQGDNAKLSIGTDEHGTKIAQKATENNVAPQELVDNLQPEFAKMRAALNLNFGKNLTIDDIQKPLAEQNIAKQNVINVRTTDSDHVRRIQAIWTKLDAAGVIYKSTYEGWYCVGCEKFLTETEAKDANYICPDHQKNLEKLSEENYYLKVSKFTDQIRDFATKNIVPKWRGKEILELIKDGAQDVSISRPADKLSWGVPVPDDNSQVMYVWVDALSNYITALGFPDENYAKEFWPLTKDEQRDTDENAKVIEIVG
jgi:methionyl-tRNA synthetase